MTECVNIIVSDGSEEGIFEYNIDVPSMAIFTAFIEMIPVKIELDKVMMWSWNT
jgi:hypothetical protein